MIIKLLLSFHLIFCFCEYNCQNIIADFRRSIVCIGRISKIKSSNKTEKNIFSPVGTAVIMYINGGNGKPYPCLVTAKHVVESKKLNWNPTSLQIRFSSNDTLGFDEYIGMTVFLKINDKVFWYPHPDSTVDLACIPLLKVNTTESKEDPRVLIPIRYNTIGNNNDIFEGSEIFVLGFPGLAGSDVLVRSILRQGIISWTNPKHSDEKTYLIDCNIYPGNSGGPVFTMPFRLDNNYGLKNGGDVKFAGIVTQVYFESQYSTDSSFEKPVFDKNNKHIFFNQKAALGVVEPPARIKELLNYVASLKLTDK